MNKLTIMVMAALCLLLMACESQVEQSLTTSNAELELRSVENITLTFQAESGLDTTFVCKNVEVEFFDNNVADIYASFQNSSSYSALGSNIRLVASQGYLLDVEVDNNPLLLGDLSILVQEDNLSYSSASPITNGTGFDFIIGDEPDGF